MKITATIDFEDIESDEIRERLDGPYHELGLPYLVGGESLWLVQVQKEGHTLHLEFVDQATYLREVA